MCFSFEVSLGTFLFSWGTSVYLLQKNLTPSERQNVIFLMIFSSMQLVDAILWYIGMKKNYLNFFLSSYVIPLILTLQIFYSMIVINKLNDWKGWLVVMLWAISLFSSYRGYTQPSENCFSSPNWGGTKQNPWYLVIFFFFIFYGRIGLTGSKFYNLLFGILTLSLTFMIGDGFGSIWCSLANVAALCYLVQY